MNWLSKTLIIFSLVFLCTDISRATLIDLGNDITYDDVSDLYWYNNLRSTYYTNYDEAKDFYEAVTRVIQIGDETLILDNFHMATDLEYLALMSNAPEDIVDTFIESNIEPDEVFYVGRFDEAGPSEGSYPTHYYGGFFGSLRYGDPVGDWMLYGPVTVLDEARGRSPIATCAWGVASLGDPIDPVPEPATMLLLGTGLFSLALVSGKKFIGRN